MTSWLPRAVAALVAAAAVVVPVVSVGAAPAHAAGACPGGTGVTVVVDPNGLGGPVQGGCVGDGDGKVASAVFDAAGFDLNLQTPRNPGYICQVNAQPEGCGPPDGNRYWSLWWSDGRSGAWTYSGLGVTSLTVYDGYTVALSWDGVPGDDRPSYSPAVHTGGSTPSPSPQPTVQPTVQPTQPTQPTQPGQPTQPQPGQPGQPDQPGQPGQPGQPSSSAAPAPGGTTSPTTPSAGPADPSGAPTPSSGAPARPGATTTPSPTPSAPGGTTGPAVPSPTGTEAPQELADPVAPAASSTQGAGVPLWLAGLVVVLLLAIAGVVTLLRRRATGASGPAGPAGPAAPGA